MGCENPNEASSPSPRIRLEVRVQTKAQSKSDGERDVSKPKHKQSRLMRMFDAVGSSKRGPGRSGLCGMVLGALLANWRGRAGGGRANRASRAKRGRSIPGLLLVLAVLTGWWWLERLG